MPHRACHLDGLFKDGINFGSSRGLLGRKCICGFVREFSEMHFSMVDFLCRMGLECRSMSARKSGSLVPGVGNFRVFLYKPLEVMERSCFGAQSLQAVSPELEKHWVSSEPARSPNEVEFLFSSLAFCEALRSAAALPICAWTWFITARLHVESCSR